MKIKCNIYAKNEQVHFDVGRIKIIIPLAAAKEMLQELDDAIRTVERCTNAKNE